MLYYLAPHGSMAILLVNSSMSSGSGKHKGNRRGLHCQHPISY
jgi:hypothetical protein